MGDVQFISLCLGTLNHIKPLQFASAVNSSLEFGLLALCPADGKIQLHGIRAPQRLSLGAG